MDTTNADYDAVWKQAIVCYIVDFASLFLGEAWLGAPEPESLDAELARCSRNSKLGLRRVDKLLRAVGPDGGPCLWHIEVQAARQRDFAERMLICHYRLYDHFGLPVRSIAILGDPSPTWHPNGIVLSSGRTQLSLTFETVKLRNFDDKLAELLLSDNFFAWLTVAHVLTLRTRREPNDRMLVKIKLLTGLRACGWAQQKFRDTVDLIDRMMTLPKAFQDEVDRQQQFLEGGQEMAWKYLWEERAEERGLQRGIAAGTELGLRQGQKVGMELGLREGLEKGVAQGLVKGLEKGQEMGLEQGLEQGREQGRVEGRLAALRELLCAQLVQRFGHADDAVHRRIEVASGEELERWCRAVVTARTIEEVF